MLIVTWLLLLGMGWMLWNLHQEIGRLDDLVAQWQETLIQVKQLDQADQILSADASTSQQPLRVIVEISDAVELASRYH